MTKDKATDASKIELTDDELDVAQGGAFEGKGNDLDYFVEKGGIEDASKESVYGKWDKEDPSIALDKSSPKVKF